ncbi:MAG: winged helix-turn-helix domain-containing protein, partial [Pseudobdellovibrionaceae bacterium]
LSLKGRFSFQQKDFSLSNQLFSKALELASHERERSQALFGLGLSHYYLGSQETSFSYFLSLYEGSRELEFRASALNFMAMIHNSKNQFSEAFGMIEKTKTLAKDDRNLYLHVYALIIEAEFYLLKGDFFSAQKAVLMAEVFVPNNYVCAAKNKLSSLKEKIATSLQEPGFEVVESESQTTVKTPDHSAVDFSSQPILLNLLKTLAGSPRRVVSKEEIAKSRWSQDYHPLHMDNKIYVTVRRLRKLLGDNTEKPVFILKKEDGYVLNPEFRFTLFQRKYFENQTEAR